jgi:two-component sensor histidine kinase/PAS domain-containing protein
MNNKGFSSIGFKDYFKQADDRARLKNVLYLFTFVMCPLFSVLFYWAGAPTIYSLTIASGAVVFPIIIFIEQKITLLKGKLPLLFFIYFTALTFWVIYDLRVKEFETNYFAFFTALFSVFIFSLQRFWYSFFYFLASLIFLLLCYFTLEIENALMPSRLVLFACIGSFFLAMYYSRNKLILNIQDYNSYLKSIVNNPGVGFVLFEIINDQANVIEFNKDALDSFSVKETSDLQEKIQKSWSLKERRKISSLETDESYQNQLFENSKILDVKINPIHFKTGKYYLATINDVTQELEEQKERSKEILRAELAEEANKILAQEIENRKLVETKLKDQILRTQAILESSSETLMLSIDTDFFFLNFNSHFKNYFSHQTGRKIGDKEAFLAYFSSVFDPIKLRYISIILSQVKQGKSHQVELNIRSVHHTSVWLEIFINPIFNEKGSVQEIAFVFHDITSKKENEIELLQSLKEKEVLLKEVHHRVKNNLQIISSILNLQSNYVQDEKLLEVLDESRSRVRSMSLIHENLYRTSNFASINFSEYIQELAQNLVASYRLKSDLRVELSFNMDTVDLNLDVAIPCGLVLNEIITNTMKYAFPAKKVGEIAISLEEDANNIRLTVADNGIGLPTNYDYLHSETLGMQLILTLVEQVDGSLEIENLNGLKYLITFERQKSDGYVKS